jgi:hypothetical protein
MVGMTALVKVRNPNNATKVHVQLMVDGVTGEVMVLAQGVVEEDTRHDIDPATILHQLMVEGNAVGVAVIRSDATLIHVQGMVDGVAGEVMVLAPIVVEEDTRHDIDPATILHQLMVEDNAVGVAVIRSDATLMNVQVGLREKFLGKFQFYFCLLLSK